MFQYIIVDILKRMIMKVKVKKMNIEYIKKCLNLCLEITKILK